MKKIFLGFILVFFSIPIGSASTTIGETLSSTYPFTSNQRAICRDGSGMLHVVWVNDTIIEYSNSLDGKVWSSNILDSSSHSKRTPHISCDGNNITVGYMRREPGLNAIMIHISNNSGATWFSTRPRWWSAAFAINNNVVVERRGQNIYVVYEDGDSFSGFFYSDINFFNSTDGGQTWGPDTVLMNGSFKSTSDYVQFRQPSMVIDGSGGSSDRIYVAASSYNTSQERIVFTRSLDSGTNWLPPDSIKLVLNCDRWCYHPSITYNQFDPNNIYLVYYYLLKNVLFSESNDGGDNWLTPVPLNTTTDTSRYASVTTNENGDPAVFWGTNQYHDDYDIVYRERIGGVWQSQKKITNDNLGHSYVNTIWTLGPDNKVHYIYRNGTSSPYQIIYSDFIPEFDFESWVRGPNLFTIGKPVIANIYVRNKGNVRNSYKIDVKGTAEGEIGEDLSHLVTVQMPSDRINGVEPGRVDDTFATIILLGKIKTGTVTFNVSSVESEDWETIFITLSTAYPIVLPEFKLFGFILLLILSVLIISYTSHFR